MNKVARCHMTHISKGEDARENVSAQGDKPREAGCDLCSLGWPSVKTGHLAWSDSLFMTLYYSELWRPNSARLPTCSPR